MRISGDLCKRERPAGGSSLFYLVVFALVEIGAESEMGLSEISRMNRSSLQFPLSVIGKDRVSSPNPAGKRCDADPLGGARRYRRRGLSPAVRQPLARFSACGLVVLAVTRMECLKKCGATRLCSCPADVMPSGSFQPLLEAGYL